MTNRLSLPSRLLVWTAIFGLIAPPSYANPVGGNVESGSATITTSGKTLDVNQTSGSAIIDWKSFDIAPNETTKFIQPNASSLTVNKINDSNPSRIFGTLSANGNLVLINQNGILFEKGSQVNVGSLVATTSQLDENQFKNGKLVFTPGTNPSAEVINSGAITAKQAGLVGLVAPQAINDGVISAKLGKVHLASGDAFALDLAGDGLINVKVTGNVGAQLVENAGLIEANGGTVNLTAAAAKSIVNSLVENSGTIEAESVGNQTGQIELYAEGSNAVPGNVSANKGQKAGSSTTVNSGTLDASGYGSGQTGGSISVLGDNVGILSGSVIDSSGDKGGGTIQIGGDFHGAGTTPAALNVYVDPNSLVLANAVTAGNGGNVAVWSDDKNWFYGNIIAEGGQQSGNGGFVETSGHGQLDAEGYVDLSAPNGVKGTYLLDPATIEIYGNVTPAFNATDGSINLSSALQLWLDASNTSSVTLSYNSTGTTASGNSGTNTITVGSNSGLVVGERIQLGGTTHSYAASVNDNSADGIYTITSISGTTITLDANLGSTYSGATLYGGYVSQINDKSSNGNNATQSTAANMPLWISNGQNGLGVMQFNGTSDVLDNLSASNLMFPGKADSFVVGELSSSTGSNTGVFVMATGSNNDYQSGGMLVWNSGYNAGAPTGADSRYNNTYGGGGGQVDNLTLSMGTPYIYEFQQSASGQTVNIDNASIASDTATSTSISPNEYAIGARLTGGSPGNYSKSNVSEVILYNTALSTIAQALVSQYQSAKWGIALAGPGNATGETGLTGTEAQQAMASTQLGATTDGYSVFADTYLERLSATSNIQLAASGNVTLDLQGDNMALAAGKSIAVTSSAGNINFISPGTITTNNANITLTPGAGSNISLSPSSAVALSSQGGAISLAGPLSLGSALTVNSGGGNVSFGGTVNGAQNLTVNSGAGTTTFSGAIGGTTPIGALNVTGPATVNGNIATANQPITFNSAVTLGGNSVWNAGTGEITTGSTVDGDYNLTATAGSMSFGGAIGGGTALNNVSIDSTGVGALALPAIHAATLTAISGGDVDLGGNIVTSGAGNAVVLAAGGNFNNAGSYAITPGTGRWIIYSTQSSSDAKGGLVESQDIYGQTYGSEAPGSVPGALNTWVYADYLGSITITANSQSVTYGSAVPGLTYSCSGGGCGSVSGALAVTNETGGNVLAGATASHSNGIDVYSSSNGIGTAGQYTINEGTLADNGYQITYDSANLTVGTKALTVSGASANNKVYDSATSATLNTGSDSLSGVVGTDSVMLSSPTTGTFATKNVGTGIAVTPTTAFSISGAQSGDYTLTQPTLAANISPATLTIAGVSANDKTYDGVTAATLNTAGDSLVGVIGGDTVNLSNLGATGAFTDKNAGNGKTVNTSGFAISGADSGNYSLTNPTLTGNILPAPLTVSADNQSMTQGGSVPTLTATITGFVNGETLVTSGVTGSPALSTTGTSSSAAGSYPIAAAIGSLSATNYNFASFVNGTLFILAGMTGGGGGNHELTPPSPTPTPSPAPSPAPVPAPVPPVAGLPDSVVQALDAPIVVPASNLGMRLLSPPTAAPAPVVDVVEAAPSPEPSIDAGQKPSSKVDIDCSSSDSKSESKCKSHDN